MKRWQFWYGLPYFAAGAFGYAIRSIAGFWSIPICVLLLLAASTTENWLRRHGGVKQAERPE